MRNSVKPFEEPNEFIIEGENVLLPGTDHPIPASITVSNGKIKEIKTNEVILTDTPSIRTIPSTTTPASPTSGAAGAGCTPPIWSAAKDQLILSAGHHWVMAGLVDTHTHINEPGRTDWEGFQSATRAAAAGGITTVVDMPLNSIPPTTNKNNLMEKLKAAQSSCLVDFGFWGGLIPGNSKDLPELVKSGVMGIKAFLIDSGVTEFPMVNESQLREGMKLLAPLKVPLILHAELESPVGQDHATDGGSGSDYQNYLHSRPSQWEVDAIRLVIKLMKETGCRCHIVHLSASEALPDIKQARSQGLPLTVETCPHYLVFDSESIAAGMTQFKCAPPIRPKANKEKLWQALMDGDIDMIVSDHSPCTPQLKKLSTGNFFDAWGGISGLQLSLPAVWTEMERRKIPVSLISQWMSSAPAHFVGIHRQKGALKTGLDADIVIWNPEEEFSVTPEIIKHRHHLTPYEGRLMKGRVIKTLVRGKTVFENDQFDGKTSGQWIQPKSEWDA